MKKKKGMKLFIWIIIVLMVVTGFGAGGTFFIETLKNKDEDKEEVVANESEEDEEVSNEANKDKLNEIITMNENGYKPAEIEKRIDELVGEVDKETATKMIRELMESMELAASYFSQMLYVMESELIYASAIDESEALIENKDDLTNELAKGYLNEMERQKLIVKDINGSFFIEPDSASVLEKYGKQLTGVFKDYVNITASQQTDPIFDEEKGEYYPEKIRDLIVELDLSRDRWELSEFASDFETLETFYYGLIFGLTQGTFFDTNVENEGTEDEEVTYILKDKVLEAYESIILEDKNLELSKRLAAYVEVLKDNDYEMNDDVLEFLEKQLSEEPIELNEEVEDVVEEEVE